MTTNISSYKITGRGRARGTICGVQRNKSRRRGAALIEFALIATVFFTMLLGLIQFGIYQSTANTLWNLSREGARFAIVDAPTPTDAAITQHIKEIAPPNINKNNLTIIIEPPIVAPATTRTSGQPVTVRLNYNMRDKIIFPNVGNVLKSTYSTNSTMRVE